MSFECEVDFITLHFPTHHTITRALFKIAYLHNYLISVVVSKGCFWHDWLCMCFPLNCKLTCKRMFFTKERYDDNVFLNHLDLDGNAQLWPFVSLWYAYEDVCSLILIQMKFGVMIQVFTNLGCCIVITRYKTISF